MGNILGVSLASTLADLYVARVATIPDFVVPSYARVVAGYEALINAWAIGTKAALETATAMFADPSVSGYVPGAGTLLTAGAACARVGNMAWLDDNSRDLVQATPLNQPWLLVHTGTNYVAFPGVTQNFCSTPNAAANQITGDLRIDALHDVILSSLNECYASKYLSSSQFLLRKNSSNFLQLIGSRTAGAEDINATSTVAITAGLKWLRAFRQASTGDVSFFTSPDAITWTQLGTTRSTPVGNLVSGTDAVNIGIFSTTGNPLQGKLYRLLLATSLGGAPVLDFNPQLYNASVSQTTIPSSTGEVYTLNVGTATTGYKLAAVDKTIIQSNGIDTTFATLTIARNQPYTEYIVGQRLGIGNFLARATGNIRGHDATNYSLNNGVLLNLANTSRNRQLLTYRSNGASSGMAINNGAETTGNAGTNNGTNITVLGGNHSLNSLIVSTANDSGAARTAIYDYLKTINAGI